MACPVFDKERIPYCIPRTTARALHVYVKGDITLQRGILGSYRYIGSGYAVYTAIRIARGIGVVKNIARLIGYKSVIRAMVQAGAETTRGIKSIGRHAKVSIPVCKRERKQYRIYGRTGIGQVHDRIRRTLKLDMRLYRKARLLHATAQPQQERQAGYDEVLFHCS